MWRGLAGVMVLAGLAGCATETPPLPNPAAIAAQEWEHGPPWGPEELPWIAPPAYAFGPGYGLGYWGPDYWGPGIGLGFGLGGGWWRGHGWRGHPGFIHRPPGGFHGHGFHQGGHRGRH